MMPSVFVSHGSPTLPFDHASTTYFFTDLGHALGKPHAIVCISAHWEAYRPSVSFTHQPKTIHDFYGFPDRLYKVQYPAPGSPAIAERVHRLLKDSGLAVEKDANRGLDHGTWVPLMLMYPSADVPVIQLSVQTAFGPQHHLSMGRALARLREENVLILGSGGATHNLADLRPMIDAEPPEYAKEFDAWLEDAVVNGRENDLLDYLEKGPAAQTNHPTAEHFLPLFVPMGAGKKARTLHKAFTWGAMSMAAFAWE
jgi:4,5-DOPA dioxygenase extradiol